MKTTYLKSLRLVYFALAMGIVSFMLITILLNNLNGPLSGTDISSADRVPFLVALVVLSGAAFMVYKVVVPRKILVSRELSSAERKLAAWRELCVLEAALIEAPAFFAIILFMMLGVYQLLAWPIAGLLLFWLRQPTIERLKREINLSQEEMDEFDSLK